MLQTVWSATLSVVVSTAVPHVPTWSVRASAASEVPEPLDGGDAAPRANGLPEGTNASAAVAATVAAAAARERGESGRHTHGGKAGQRERRRSPKGSGAAQRQREVSSRPGEP